MAEEERFEQEQSDPAVLSEFYKPAERDSRIGIRFVGNTAMVADAALGGVDPFQMIAAAGWLKRKAYKIMDVMEARHARSKIQVAGEDDIPGFPGFGRERP